MPQEAHYVFWGQLLRAHVSGDLSFEETMRLMEKLDLPSDRRRIEEFVLFGDDEEYQRDRREASTPAVS
jgi:hypothetical protein